MNGTATVSALRQWQAGLRDAVLRGDARIARQISGDDVASARQRLQIYTEAYGLRLLEILQEDFSAVHTLLGPARFEHLARAYIAAHASTQHSVRWFGAGFEDFLHQRRTRPAWIAELAGFEWDVGEVLDAADATPMTAQDLAAIPPERWPTLCLQPAPAVRLHKWAWNVTDLLQAAQRTDAQAMQPMRLERPRWCLVWRHRHEARWRALEQPEAWALRVLQRGGPLAAAGSALQRAGVPLGQVPAQLVTCLQQWLAAGILRSAKTP